MENMLKNKVGQPLQLKASINILHSIGFNQDINCPIIKWTEDFFGDGEWKCLRQERNGISAILSVPKEREKIPRENLDYFIYLPCNCSNHESCPYILNMKAG